MPKLEMLSTTTHTRWWERKHITRNLPQPSKLAFLSRNTTCCWGARHGSPPTQLCAQTAAMSKAQKVASLTRIILSAEERNTDRDTDRHEESPIHSTALVNADQMCTLPPLWTESEDRAAT